jgi:hypothetical protein
MYNTWFPADVHQHIHPLRQSSTNPQVCCCVWTGGGKRVLRNCSFSGSNDGKPWYFGSTSFSDKPLWVFPKIGVFPKSSKSWMTVLALKTMVTWGIPPRLNGHLNEKMVINHLNWWPVVPQFGIAKLVNISPISLGLIRGLHL